MGTSTPVGANSPPPASNYPLMHVLGALMLGLALGWLFFSPKSSTPAASPIAVPPIAAAPEAGRAPDVARAPAPYTPPERISAAQPLSEPTRSPAARPQRSYNLDGPGTAATPLFELEAGLAVFRMTYTGEANFIAVLMDANGGKVEFLANEIGSWTGSKAMKVPATGRYLLDVQASGPWTITISGP